MSSSVPNGPHYHRPLQRVCLPLPPLAGDSLFERPSFPGVDLGWPWEERHFWHSYVLQPSLSVYRRWADAAAPLDFAVLPFDGGKKSGGPNLHPGVLEPSSSLYRRRSEMEKPLVLALRFLGGGKLSGGPDPCPDVLQLSFSVSRRRPEVSGVLPVVVLALGGGEKGGGRDPCTVSTTCNRHRHICITRSEPVLTCEEAFVSSCLTCI